MFKQKRGVTQTQFNWIFIAIAGALILLFFISMVYKQKSIAEEKSDIEIQKNLQAILTGAEVSKQTENIISVPEKEIRYDCEGFSIGALSGFNPRIVFSPDTLKSNKRELILYSLEWRVPFRITNFLYVTSPEVRYIIVDDTGQLAEGLKKLLPENMKIETVSDLSGSILDKNNYKIKFIIFNNNFNKNKDLSNLNGDISAIHLKNKFDEYGEIEFYDYNKDNNKFEIKKTLPYLKNESLIGAIFSENHDIYECNMEKAKTRLKKVYKIYKERVEELKRHYASYGPYTCIFPDCNPDCWGHYTGLNLNADSLTTVYNNLENLENKNQIVALYSCALIY